MGISVLTAILAVICLHRSESRSNNVCRRFEDYPSMQQNPNCWYNPDVGASPAQLAKNHGFPFTMYEIASPDGYILQLFRIPHNGTDPGRKRIPVLLHHGILFDALTFLGLGKNSPAFVMSNNGYDVWLTNVRGSTYSSKHVKYTNYDLKYWDFSFHEMGLYDLPVVIDFIAAKTGQKGNIALVGYSMGTTASFIYASSRPKHARANLRTIVSLAPVAFMGHVKTVGKIIATYSHLLPPILGPLLNYGVGRNLPLLTDLPKQICQIYPFMLACQVLAEMLSGSNPGEIKPEDLPVLMSESYSGFSIKTFQHYSQFMLSGKFQQYDYGIEQNLIRYNSTSPPQYDLSRIRVPVHLFYGKSDFLAVEEDVMALHDSLKTKKTVTSVFEDDQNYYSHLDFYGGHNTPNLYNMISQDIGT